MRFTSHPKENNYLNSFGLKESGTDCLPWEMRLQAIAKGKESDKPYERGIDNYTAPSHSGKSNLQTVPSATTI